MEEEPPKNRSYPLNSKGMVISVIYKKRIEDSYDECIPNARKEKSVTVRKRPEKALGEEKPQREIKDGSLKSGLHLQSDTQQT
jgi:hypothetical protein